MNEFVNIASKVARIFHHVNDDRSSFVNVFTATIAGSTVSGILDGS